MELQHPALLQILGKTRLKIVAHLVAFPLERSEQPPAARERLVPPSPCPGTHCPSVFLQFVSFAVLVFLPVSITQEGGSVPAGSDLPAFLGT